MSFSYVQILIKFPNSKDNKDYLGLKGYCHLKSGHIWDKLLDLVHWEDLEGAGGEEGGRGDRDEEHM